MKTKRARGPAPEPARLVSIAELCARLNISRACLYKPKWIQRLPPRRKIGSRTGYLASEVDAFILSLPAAPGTAA